MPNVQMPGMGNILGGADGSSSAFSNLLPNSAITPPDTSTMPSSGIQMPSELSEPTGVLPGQASTISFSNMLGQFVSEVNDQSAASAQTVSALQSGQSVPLHKAVIAMEEANVSFQLMVEVRNRLLDSYQEIMRMQV
jgi:flagellar hook-basal body complex protein FliE